LGSEALETAEKLRRKTAAKKALEKAFEFFDSIQSLVYLIYGRILFLFLMWLGKKKGVKRRI
jgi:hypothetical protein